MMNFTEIANRIFDAMNKSGVPQFWDGRESITQMKNEGSRHWRQMEWIGFYFQFLCERLLHEEMQIPGPKYGNAEFDGFLEIPWDFKAHAINTSAHKIIANDREAIECGITEHGAVGLILALGEVQYNDEARTFQSWHGELKGGKSKYEKERIARGAWSRLRKVSFDAKQICMICLHRAALERTGQFQQDFRNADGSPRRVKVMVDLEKLAESDAVYFDL